jgi:hypothetical protein
MALTYLDSANLMNDASFISRIKVACLNFANYILAEEPTVVAHNTRLKWGSGHLAGVGQHRAEHSADRHYGPERAGAGIKH